MHHLITKKCPFPNLRYHSWDLRFINSPYDISPFFILSMYFGEKIKKKLNTKSVKPILKYLLGIKTSLSLKHKLNKIYREMFFDILVLQLE